MTGLYLILLLAVIACLVLVDFKYKLAFYKDFRGASITLAMLILFFCIWDIVGIKTGIFFTGNTKLLTGWHIIKNFPIEEMLFLTVLNYTSLLLWLYARRRYV